MTTAPRRTQEERSSAMRGRLLDATIECLVEYGYASTTTRAVADKAGVTRGAQVHHFPTKADLVIAAIDHLATLRTEHMLAEIDRVGRTKDAVGGLLDVLWDVHQGPIFSATVELWVAARTDDELRGHLEGGEPFTGGITRDVAVRLAAAGFTSPRVLMAVYTSMDAIRGLLIGAWGSGDAQVAARWRRAKPLLRLMFGP